MVGTDRRTAPIANGDGPASALANSLTETDPARRLLLLAALHAPCRRAGRRPEPVAAADMPEPAPADSQRSCRRAAAGDLARMLGGEFTQALPEWLRALAERGMCAPHDHLPELLARAEKDKDLRPLVLDVLGERGRWLASFHSDWEFAAGRPVSSDADGAIHEELWQTGNHSERLSVLRLLRERSPERGRELVASTWAQDSPEERAAFLEEFRIGLSLTDEAFLEPALDDRRKEVRRAAADLLGRMKGSALVRRMEDRARPLLKTSRKLLGGDMLEVDLPDACTKEMIRDGIEPKPPQGTGERAWWLAQVLGAVPPDFWSRHLGRSAANLIQSNRSKEWSATVLDSWSRAAQRFRDADWAEELLRTWIDRAGSDNAFGGQPWWEVLPDTALQVFAQRAIERSQGSLQGGHAGLLLLRQCGSRWSHDLSRAVLQRVTDHARAVRSQPYQLYEVAGRFKEWADRVHPDVEREWLAAWEEIARDGAPRNAIDHHREFTQFRRTMLARLAE